jgi:hypothetical protein
MKLAVILSPVAIAASAACASSQPSPDATTTAHPTATIKDSTEAEIRVIAEKTARDAGYDLGVYEIKDVTLERTRAPNPDWVVFFEHKAPAPPGGHFTVYVDPDTKTARLVPGK